MTSNNNDLDRIVGELISIEPELGRDEAKLRELVSRLLASKPDVKVDSQFVARLRRELIAGEKMPVANRIAGFNKFMTRLQYILGGSAMVAAVLLIAVVATSPKGSSGPTGRLADLVTGQQEAVSGVSALGPNAFGTLIASSEKSVSLESSNEQAVTGFGGGGRTAAPSAIPWDSSISPNDAAIGLPSPEYEAVGYRYVGEPLAGFESEMTVYRRAKATSAASLASAVAAYNNGLVRLSGLPNLNVNSISLKHDLDGQDYWVNLDTLQGTASINLEYGMRGYEEVPAQAVSDERLIALADEFLDRYGIDRSGYAAPALDQSWRASYPAGEMQVMPNFVQVNYQLVVGGQPVVGWGNQPYGLQVMIDAGHLLVQNAYNIMTQRFESSAYVVETDASRLTTFAEAGGLGGQFWVPKGSVSAIELGTPTMKYYQHYQYDEQIGTSQELYVPTLFFPVLNAPAEMGSYQQFVMVPLVKEILDAQQQNGIGFPTPYPLMEAGQGVESRK